LSPQPVALAGAWLIIVGLQFATPDETPASRPASVALLKAHVREQQQLIAELLNPAERFSAPKNYPKGAALRRGKTQPA
jgi:hypothetical protein